MPPTHSPNGYIDSFNRAMEYLSPLFDLAIRVWVARAFFLSGLSKIQSWDTTLTLFQFEYSVPLLPPNVAAYLATAAELSLPVFVAVGLLGRASSLALFLFNGVAVYSYASFLLSDAGAAGLGQHILWGTMLLMLVFHGPGKLSADQLLQRWIKP
jgi:putative oxidoreductase